MTTHVDIVADFDQRSVMTSANDLKRNLQRSGDEAGDAWAAGFQRSAPKIQKAYEQAYGGAAKAASTLRAEEAKLADVRGKAQKSAEELAEKEGRLEHFRTNLPTLTATIAEKERELVTVRERHSSVMTQLTVRSEALTRAHISEQSAMSGLGDAFKSVQSGADGAASSMTSLSSVMGKVGSIGAPLILVGIAGAAVELAGVAASAAQSLWLLPAAAGAAGAAIGTVALATYGFGDALKAIGDPKKFGEALRELSPNAQQAALSIQAMMPAFTQLRNATSDAFFANVGPQLNQLTDQLLPTIQTMTTGIAGAMNQAFSGVAQQLMTPQTMSAINTFTTNVVSAFEKLAPAIAPFTSAIAEIAKVGSGFLPQLAQEATKAAQAFSTFINIHAGNGDLQRWMSEGLETLKQLGSAAVILGGAFMDLAPVGQAILPDIVNLLKQMAEMVPLIAQAAVMVGPSFGLWAGMIMPAVKLIGLAADGIAFISGDAAKIAKSDMLNARIEAAFGGRAATDPTLMSVNNRTSRNIPGVPPGGYALPTPGADAHGIGGVPDVTWQSAQQGKNFGMGQAVPAAQAGPGGRLGQAPQSPYDTSLPPGFENLTPTPALYSAETSYMDANTTLAEKRARLNQLDKGNVATAAELQDARNDVLKSERDQHEAEMRLYAARDEMFKKANKQLSGAADSMGEIGAKLDQDLGISKGLSGMAENLIKFVASLAAAPLLGQLDAIANAPGQAKGGFGLMGVLGAQGAFGAQYTAAGQAAADASAIGPAGLQVGAASGNVNAMLALAQSASGRTKYDGASDLVNGLADCSGSISDLVEIFQTGQTSAARLFTTTNFASDAEAAKLGFLPGNMPGALNVGVNPYPGNSGHMAATLPNGVNFEGGGGTGGGAQYGGSASGALDPQFEKHYYLPVGAGGALSQSWAPNASGSAPASGGYGGPSFPVPLPVTIVGGLSIPVPVGGGGGAPAGGPAPGTTGTAGAPGDPYAPTTPGGPTGAGLAPGAAPAAPTPWTSPAPGLPPGMTGGGGNAPIFGAAPPLQGVGQGVGAPGGPTKIGGGDGLTGTGKGGVGMTPGGSLDTALSMAAGAADLIAPGAGQAAQTGIKLANRAIQYGAQVGGIMTQGAIDTFLPFGGSKLASNSWATRLIGGLAGGAPALPNMAGKAAAAPEGQGGQGQGGQGGNTYGDTNISVKEDPNRGADGTGKDVAYHYEQSRAMPGKP